MEKNCGPRGAGGAACSVFLGCFRVRSDVVVVVEIGRIQPVIVPLSPLLHCLPVPLFLLWDGKMKSL
jgi:hypothetical protein